HRRKRNLRSWLPWAWSRSPRGSRFNRPPFRQMGDNARSSLARWHVSPIIWLQIARRDRGVQRRDLESFARRDREVQEPGLQAPYKEGAAMELRPNELTTLVRALGDTVESRKRQDGGPEKEIEIVRLRLLRLNLMEERLRLMEPA